MQLASPYKECYKKRSYMYNAHVFLDLALLVDGHLCVKSDMAIACIRHMAYAQ